MQQPVLSAPSESIQVQKGSLVEVLSEGDWWEAEITKIKGGQARVHYVGGADDEDEWIPIGSDRIRLPQPEASQGNRLGKRGRSSLFEAVEPVPVPSSLPFKRSSLKDPTKKRPWKALKKVLEAEGYERLPPDAPTYVAIEAPPSLLPAKKYCDLTGLEAKYTDPKTKLRYFSGTEYLQIRYMSEHNVQEYLKLRNAMVALK